VLRVLPDPIARFGGSARKEGMEKVTGRERRGKGDERRREREGREREGKGKKRGGEGYGRAPNISPARRLLHLLRDCPIVLQAGLRSPRYVTTPCPRKKQATLIFAITSSSIEIFL